MPAPRLPERHPPQQIQQLGEVRRHAAGLVAAITERVSAAAEALRRSSTHMTRGSSAKSNTADKTDASKNSPTAPCIPFQRRSDRALPQ